MSSSSTSESSSGSSSQPYSVQVNPGFAVAQLLKATGKGQASKVEKWSQTIQGIANNFIQVGTRLPVKDVPAFVTLEVLHGGFASGNFKAGGSLQPHEIELFKQIFPDSQEKDEEKIRESLNKHFLSTPKLLESMLQSHQYRINTPEEGALLSVCALLKYSNEDAAKEVVSAISPWFHKLRFYPIPATTPLGSGVEVSVCNVGQLLEKFSNPKPPNAKVNTILSSFLPLYDRLILCVLATTSGDTPPNFQTGEGDHPARVLVGDLPFRNSTHRLKEEFQSILDEIQKNPTFSCSRKIRKKNFGLMLNICRKFFILEKVTDRETEKVREMIAEVNVKRGLPGSERLQNLRKIQKEQVEKSYYGVYYGKLIEKRLSPLNKETGIEDFPNIASPISEKEAIEFNLTAGQEIPDYMLSSIEKGKLASLEVLCNEKIIPSLEILATLNSSFVAAANSAGLEDPDLLSLYFALYKAFKNRRSLLLVNLESQIRFKEIVWCSGIDQLRSKSKSSDSSSSLQALRDMVSIGLLTWPNTMFPNKFVGTLQDLVKDAKLQIPLLKEVASDIFMHAFTAPYVSQAQTAANLLKGTLYERYYKLNFNDILAIKTPQNFYDYCSKSVGGERSYDVVNNGKIIEHAMIATTHNVAELFVRLDLIEKLATSLPSLVREIVRDTLKQIFQLGSMPWKTRLQTLKNLAYGWRNLILFLSLMSKEDVEVFFDWIDEYIASQKDSLAKRFEPCLNYLKESWKGNEGNSEYQFRGWTKGRHFLMPEKQEQQPPTNPAKPTPL